MHFQGKEGFEQEETEKATEGQVKSQIKNKGKTLITNCYTILHLPFYVMLLLLYLYLDIINRYVQRACKAKATL